MGLVIRGVLGSFVVQPEPNDKADPHLTYTFTRDTIMVGTQSELT